MFLCAPCAKTYTWGVHEGGVPLVAGFEGAQPLALIIVLVWLLHGHRLHQFASLGGSQCPRTAVPQLCTLCEYAVFANLVNTIKLGGSARLRGRCPQAGVVSRDERQFTGWSRLWPRIVVGLVAAGEILEHR